VRLVSDAVDQLSRIRAACLAAGLMSEALAIDDSIRTGISLECCWNLVGRWREKARKRAYRDALVVFKTGNCSRDGESLRAALLTYAERQFSSDQVSAVAPDGERAALFTILSGDGGKILTARAYRRKFGKL
jgi:hypothetical protein